MAASQKEVLRNTLDSLSGADFKRFKHHLKDQGPIPWGKLEKADTDDTVESMVQVFTMGAGDVMVTILRKMNHNQLAMDLVEKLKQFGGQQCSSDLAEEGEGANMAAHPGERVCTAALSEGAAPQTKEPGACPVPIKVSLKRKLQARLKTRFSTVHQEFGDCRVQDIYTELYIVEGRTGGITSDHEISTIDMRQIGNRPNSDDEQIKLSNIFTAKSATKVLTLGIAGVGKTVAVQKFVMDWVEEKENQDIDFIFVLLFRELNLKKKKGDYSLFDLLLLFHPGLEDFKNLPEFTECKILLILDGLDESRLELEFESEAAEAISEPSKKSSMDILISSVIEGVLLPSALLWVTTRPAAASLIPREFFNLVTEVRGFNDPQKTEFFKKNIKNPKKADRVINHVDINRTLHIMCHIPVFCRIIASVLDDILDDGSKGDPPKTLTEVYLSFCVFQISRMNEKYSKNMSQQEKGRLLVKLGKLAFRHLEKGTLIFYEKDLKKYKIAANSGAVEAGVCTQIFKKEDAITGESIFSFVHLSVQEFLAALYALHEGVRWTNPFLKSRKAKFNWLFTHSRFDLYRFAVEKALQSPNGHLDLFVRFLLGLTPMLEPKLCSPLNVVLPQLAVREMCIDETAQYVKEKIREDNSAERTINLFHCLNELGDNSLVEELNSYMSSGENCKNMTPAQCSALAYLLLMSAEDLDVLDLWKYVKSDEGLHRMLPVVKVSRRVRLNQSCLTNASCKLLASVLQCTPSHLRDLDLSGNYLNNDGVELLCVGLRDPQCKLETLRLNHCLLTGASCKMMASVLQSSPSHLRELDMSNNYLQDEGVELLCVGLRDPQCKLTKLRIARCNLSAEACKSLAHVLQLANSLMELDLSENHVRDEGVKFLSMGLATPYCKLRTLSVSSSCISDDGYVCLALALMLNPFVQELDVSNNDPAISESAQELLAATVKDPHRTVKYLKLNQCHLTETSCEIMASVLKGVPHLRELDMSGNELKDVGVELLCEGLRDPQCKLETLRLSGCLITHRGCSFLASALKSNPSYLRELDLSYNHPGGSGVKELTDRLDDPNCKLETLRLCHGGECRITPGLRKYACELTLDPNTTNRHLSLCTRNRTLTHVYGLQLYPDHLERFDFWSQVLCREGLCEQHYWEANRSFGRTDIAVAYKSIQRAGPENGSWFRGSDKAWSLTCDDDSYSAWHNSKQTVIPVPSSRSSRVGVYLDWPAGTLSFYSVSSDTLTHLHTFHSTFTEPLYPGFGCLSYSSVSLCQIT